MKRQFLITIVTSNGLSEWAEDLLHDNLAESNECYNRLLAEPLEEGTTKEFRQVEVLQQHTQR